jgi:hypothetical protein
MKKRTIRGWTRQIPCAQQMTRVYFVLPDTFFDVALFTCLSCGALFGIDRDAEHYIGPAFDQLRARLDCPDCGSSLDKLADYPQTFRCPDGSQGHFAPSRDYPPDSELVSFEVWDPYA